MTQKLTATVPFDRRLHRLDTITVDATNDRAEAFYRTFGFEPSPLAPRTLMVSLQTVKRILG